MPGQCRLGDYHAMGWKGRDCVSLPGNLLSSNSDRHFPIITGDLVILIEPDVDNNSGCSPFTEKNQLGAIEADRRRIRSQVEFLDRRRSKQLDHLLARHSILQLLAILQCDGRPRRIWSQSRRSNMDNAKNDGNQKHAPNSTKLCVTFAETITVCGDCQAASAIVPAPGIGPCGPLHSGRRADRANRWGDPSSPGPKRESSGVVRRPKRWSHPP
jgi:hypothetical protein